MSWKPDRNLQLRMALMLVLIVVLPFAFVAALSWTLNEVVPALTASNNRDSIRNESSSVAVPTFNTASSLEPLRSIRSA